MMPHPGVSPQRVVRRKAALPVTLVDAIHTTTTGSPVEITCEPGDTIVVLHAANGVNASTIPALASGFTGILTELSGSGSNAASARASYRQATSAGEEATFDAGVKWIFTFRGAAASPIGDVDSAVGSSQSATLGGLSLAAATSFVVACVVHHMPPSLSPPTPSGMTIVGTAGQGRWGGHLGPTASFSSRSVTIGGGSDVVWLTIAVEIVAG